MFRPGDPSTELILAGAIALLVLLLACWSASFLKCFIIIYNNCWSASSLYIMLHNNADDERGKSAVIWAQTQSVPLNLPSFVVPIDFTKSRSYLLLLESNWLPE